MHDDGRHDRKPEFDSLEERDTPSPVLPAASDPSVPVPPKNPPVEPPPVPEPSPGPFPGPKPPINLPPPLGGPVGPA